MSRLQLLVALMCLGAPIATTEAHAWGFGINIGVPIYPRPYYGYPGWGYYYRPVPVVYPAPQVVVVPSVVAAPAVAAPAPVAVQSVPTVGPVPSIAPYGGAPAVVPASTASAPTAIQANYATNPARVEQLLPQLSSAEEHVRRDTAMDLGRMKATKAINPLLQTLASDTSPAVREAAARALGLIASPQALTALIHAAQADADRDVRHSAQFSVEIIRTNLRRN